MLWLPGCSLSTEIAKVVQPETRENIAAPLPLCVEWRQCALVRDLLSRHRHHRLCRTRRRGGNCGARSRTGHRNSLRPRQPHSDISPPGAVAFAAACCRCVLRLVFHQPRKGKTRHPSLTQGHAHCARKEKTRQRKLHWHPHQYRVGAFSATRLYLGFRSRHPRVD